MYIGGVSTSTDAIDDHAQYYECGSLRVADGWRIVATRDQISSILTFHSSMTVHSPETFPASAVYVETRDPGEGNSHPSWMYQPKKTGMHDEKHV